MNVLAGTLRAALATDVPAVIVTVADTEGSTPRERGARMLVTPDAIAGTIGGGRLELKAMAAARMLLTGDEPSALLELPLGPALGQCCGGRVTLLLERAEATSLDWLAALERGDGAGALATTLQIPVRHLIVEGKATGFSEDLAVAARGCLARGEPIVALAEGTRWLVEPLQRHLPLVALFGAGHVGRALASALAPLPCRVRWIDGRAREFPDAVPGNAEKVLTDRPLEEAKRLPPGAFVLVMTHSHNLDYDLCDAVLKRGDFAFLGLIGSATKRRRFERRYLAKGGRTEDLQRLVSPIGLGATTDKRPAVIAALTAAQLVLAFAEAKQTAEPRRRRA